jgi:hypothetical protein
MSRTKANSRFVRGRSLTGGVLAFVAWLALLVAPVAAQAMMRIDTGVPGAVICSVNKASEQDGGKLVAPHCQLCTLAQQAVDASTPSADSTFSLSAGTTVSTRPADTPPSRAPPRAHPPRAPPLA